MDESSFFAGVAMPCRSVSSRRRTSRQGLYIVPARRVARARRVPVGRTLHIVDIENLVGGTSGSRRMDIRRALAAYCELASVCAGDHVIIGAGPTLLPAAGLAFGRARLVLGHGIDGADRALLAELRDAAWIAAHFDRVVVGSGDGVFADAIVAIRAQGIAVGVVALSDRIAWKLRRLAHFVFVFHCDFEAQGAA